MSNLIKPNLLATFVANSSFSLVVASLLFSGCVSTTKNITTNDKNISQELNVTKVEEPKHIPSFQVSKGVSSDAIFKQLSKLDGKSYVVKKDSNFKTLYNSNPILGFDDVKDFIELHDFELKSKKYNNYITIELLPKENGLITKLEKTQVSIKGTLPLSVAVSEISSALKMGFSFDKTLTSDMSKTNHFYYVGDAKGAFEHIGQKSGVEIEFIDNKIVLEKFTTAFVSVDLPLKNRSLATNIINNISSEVSANGQTTTQSNSQAQGATASTDGFDNVIQSSDKQSIVEAYNQFIIKELVTAIKSTLTSEGKFHYIPTSGQIMLKDKAENVQSAVKLVNNFNDKFKERIDVEFKFYKLKSNEVRKRGINLTGMLNDKIATSFTPYSSLATGALNFTFNDGTTKAILNMLNQIGQSEVENTVTMYNQSNIINVEKVTSNFGYIRSIDTTIDANGNVTSEITPSSVPDGTFFAVLANGMSGNDVGINYFLSFNNLVNFLSHTTNSASIQTPNTAEQSYSNTKIVQSGIPYVISTYKVNSNRNDKTSLPLIEDTFLDVVTGTKNTESEDTYIIVTMKATKRL